MATRVVSLDRKMDLYLQSVDRIRRAREHRGISQETLARQCGMSPTMLNNMENVTGGAQISQYGRTYFPALAVRLHVSLSFTCPQCWAPVRFAYSHKTSSVTLKTKCECSATHNTLQKAGF